MTVISLNDIQHCGGTQTRSNRKLLIVPCFLLSNLGLYLSISLLLVSLIMQTKHKCGNCQLNPTTAGLPAICPYTVTDVDVIISKQCGGPIYCTWGTVTEAVMCQALYTITHPQHHRLVFYCIFCLNVLEPVTFLHHITYIQ